MTPESYGWSGGDPDTNDEEEEMLDDFHESKVTVKKEALLEALKENRKGHRAIFLDAQQGFRQAVITELDRMLHEAREGKQIRLAVGLVQPIEHTKDYDRVIRMLEMSTADEICISESQFAMYVLDDWGWKGQFIASNSHYTGRT